MTDQGSMWIVARLLGDWVVGADGLGRQSLLVVVSEVVVNVALTGLGLLILYNACILILRGARTGSFARAGSDGAMVLTRTVLSIALLSPMQGGVAAQSVAIWVVKQASSFADEAWMTVSQQQLNTGELVTDADIRYIGKQVVDRARIVLRQRLDQGTCMGQLTEHSVGVLTGPKNVEEMTRIGRRCFFDLEKMLAMQEFRPVSDGAPERVERLAIVGQRIAVASSRAQLAVLEYAIENNQRLAAGVTPADLNVIERAAGRLESEVTAAIQAHGRMPADSDERDLTAYGWISAGLSYQELSERSAQLQRIVNDALYIDVLAARVTHAEELASDQATWPVEERTIKTYEDSITGDFGRVIDTLTARESLDKTVSDWFSDPFKRIRQLAGALSVAGQTILATGAVAGGSVASLFADGGSVLLPIGWGLLAAGVALYCVLAMPAIQFLLAVMQWLIHVAELYIVAPLWVAAHAAPAGDNHTSNLAAAGYINLIYIILFPLLLIFGLVAAYAIIPIGLWLLTVFVGAFAGNLFDGAGLTTGGHVLSVLLTGIPKLAAVLIVWIVGAYAIITRSIGLVQWLPGQMLSWLSAGHVGSRAESQVQGGGAGALIGMAAGRALSMNQALGRARTGSKLGRRQPTASGNSLKEGGDEPI